MLLPESHKRSNSYKDTTSSPFGAYIILRCLQKRFHDAVAPDSGTQQTDSPLAEIVWKEASHTAGNPLWGQIGEGPQFSSRAYR